MLKDTEWCGGLGALRPVVFLALLVAVLVVAPAYAENKLHSFNITLSYSSRASGVATSLHSSLLTVTAISAASTVTTSLHSMQIGVVAFSPVTGVYTSLHMLQVSVAVLKSATGVLTSLHQSIIEITPFATSAGVSTSLHSTSITVSSFAVKVKNVTIEGCGGRICAGAEHDIVVRVYGTRLSVAQVLVTLYSDGKVVLNLTVYPATGQWSANGEAKIKSVEVREGDLIVEARAVLPWSLGDTLDVYAKAYGVLGSVSEYKSSYSVVRRFDVSYYAPASVKPGAEYSVLLKLVYSGVGRPAPPGTRVEVNGKLYTTDASGTVRVYLRAPSEPGRYTVRLDVKVLDNGQEATLSIPLEVVGETTTGETAAATRVNYTARRVRLGGELIDLTLYAWGVVATLAALLVARRRGVRALTYTAAITILLVVAVVASLAVYLALTKLYTPVVTKPVERAALTIESVNATYNETSRELRLTMVLRNVGDKPLTIDTIVLQDNLGNMYVSPIPPVELKPGEARIIGTSIRVGAKPACPCIIRVSAGGVSAYTSIETIP